MGGGGRGAAGMLLAHEGIIVEDLGTGYVGGGTWRLSQHI